MGLLSSWDKKMILTAHDREDEQFRSLSDAFFQLPLDSIDLSFDCPDPFYTWDINHPRCPEVALYVCHDHESTP
jgi:hypothetical protein